MINSAVECFVHIEKVIGSNPISPTICMFKIYKKILYFTLFFTNFFKYKCSDADTIMRNRYFALSIEDYIINSTDNVTKNINNNNFEDFGLNIKNIDIAKNISENLEKDEGHLGVTINKNETIKNFLDSCNGIIKNNDTYNAFLGKFTGKEKDVKYKIADIFLKLLIIELDYECKIYNSLKKYLDANAENFKKMKPNNQDFFEKYYASKFFCERAKSLIVVNKSLLNSIHLMIDCHGNGDEGVLKFIISQTYNKIVNIDYLWIMYTYGHRASKTFYDSDPGFSPFPTAIFKDYYNS